MKKHNNEVNMVVKKTTELTEEEIYQINDLFNKTFQKVEKNFRNKKDFEKKYLHNFLNFSFHGLMKNANEIVGCYNIIPYEFIVFSEKKLFGQSVDTTIHPNYRGNIFNLKKLANIVYDEVQKHNIFFVYGLPNEKFYLVKKKVLGWKDIGKLEYYIYPNKIKRFFGKFSVFLIFFHILTKVFLKFKLSFNYEYKFQISKIDSESFHLGRYSDDHKIISNKKYKCIYKETINKNYNNAKIVYIIDVLPLSKKNIETSVFQLLKLIRDVDLIIYVGNLKKIPNNLIKIPKIFFKNRQVNVSGKILDNKKIKETIFNISNWNINLSNFDTK
mgnify:CR=1 FL=1